jgi:hypothetical protein
LARINFELNARKRVKEQAGAKNQALAKQASCALAIFKSTIKQEIARVIDLEIKVCKDEIANEFCKAVFAIAGAFAINHPILMSQTPTISYTSYLRNTLPCCWNILNSRMPNPFLIYLKLRLS